MGLNSFLSYQYSYELSLWCHKIGINQSWPICKLKKKDNDIVPGNLQLANLTKIGDEQESETQNSKIPLVQAEDG